VKKATSQVEQAAVCTFQRCFIRMSMQKPACVIDNGTGFTKMGYAGNMEPNFIVPSLIATIADGKSDPTKDIEDLNFYIGADAQIKRENYNVDYPIRHGLLRPRYVVLTDEFFQEL
jgi:actin-related protein